MRALTHVEAQARAALIRVGGYVVTLDVTGPATFVSSTVVDFACATPGAGTFVELKDARPDRIVLNGRPLDPATLQGNRLPLPGLLAANRLEVTFTADYSHTGEGLHRHVDPEDGEVYLSGQAPLDEAQRIFACFDQPDLKAPITLTVTAPAQWTVRGNAPLAQARDGRWEFAPTPPLAPYLFTVLAGPWHERRGEHDGIPLGLLCRRSLAPHLDADAAELFAATAASFDRYHELFGVRYPFGKYDQAFVPDLAGGAVENPGLVTYREEFLFRTGATDYERLRRFVVMAHEMAHMWFGDLVTLRWWDDIWLNEAFAELMGWRVAAGTGRYPAAAADFVLWRKRWGMLADQRPSTHPVAPSGVADTTAAFLNFDGISYAKGAAVLRQLSVLLGDDVFLAGLRAYFERFRFGNATLADFLAVLGSSAGVDLTGWASLWLRSTGVNTLRAGPGPVVHQTGAPPRPHRFHIGVYDRRGALIHRAPVTLDGDSATIGDPGGPAALGGLAEAGGSVAAGGLAAAGGSAGLPEGSVLLPNDGDDTYAKLRLDPASLAALPAVLPAIADPLARALLWTAAMDATHDGELSPAAFLALLETALAGEPETAVLVEVLGFARDSLARRGLIPFGPLAALCAAALSATKPGSGRQFALATAMTTVAGPGQVAVLEDWLADDPVSVLTGLAAPTSHPLLPQADGLAGLVVTQDLRWEVLGRLVALGAAGERDIAAEERRDPSSRGAEHAARCRAAVPDAAAKADAWERIVRDERPRLAMAAATGFWQPGQEPLTDPYVGRFFTDAPAMVAGRYQLFAMTLVRQAFPRYAPGSLRLAEDLLSREDLDPVLRRGIGDAADELKIFRDLVEDGGHRSTRW
ncbi:M1 family aminopeptidase [Dactylosporangium sp. NPDC005555]|uniref:M1 family aminopeptidase n=1 Tax=Dactylosporangium sp. NPDC005555 TaxID=3154889 RepID=UPI0033A18A0C